MVHPINLIILVTMQSSKFTFYEMSFSIKSKCCLYWLYKQRILLLQFRISRVIREGGCKGLYKS